MSYLETGVLYCEDNLRQLSEFPDECIDVIYLVRRSSQTPHMGVWSAHNHLCTTVKRMRPGVQRSQGSSCQRSSVSAAPRRSARSHQTVRPGDSPLGPGWLAAFFGSDSKDCW